jgi:hypothetical protein
MRLWSGKITMATSCILQWRELARLRTLTALPAVDFVRGPWVYKNNLLLSTYHIHLSLVGASAFCLLQSLLWQSDVTNLKPVAVR